MSHPAALPSAQGLQEHQMVMSGQHKSLTSPRLGTGAPAWHITSKGSSGWEDGTSHAICNLHKALQNREVAGDAGAVGPPVSVTAAPAGQCDTSCGKGERLQGGGLELSSANQRISPAVVALSGGRGFISPPMGSTDPLGAQPIYHAVLWARVWESAKVTKEQIPSLQTRMDTQECETLGQRRP